MRPHVSPSSASSPPTSPTYRFLCRDYTHTWGWSGGKGRDASSELGFGEASDGGMDKTTREEIVRAYEVDRGDGGGRKRRPGRRRGRGEGGGGGG
jgi:hypothetical protein